ncbi:MAG: hypothetical protein AVDCRST_MAG86-4145 [uncultured Truepera sp.]|uniref:Enoyl reductase (ER) domain-containing protein n=1 Tax=uncultured Truepera sp. TaxID=543023 RepID=A0A6J4VW03_9DEIN|nr:MAG: hypothetical protein AVDCRST_MAG86-4145 [uncultured Truepera sp.]
MKAVQIQTYGTVDVLDYLELPTPQPGPGQVLIKVESAAVNFADVLRRRNDPYPFPTPLPFIPGGEVAGTVEALGNGVSGPPVGTPVFALAGAGSGGYAQYALANATGVIPIPPDLSPDVAASLVVAGSTAVLLLTEAAGLQPGESVLIPAAAGGVGTYVVQIAKLMEAGTIIAAASSSDKQALAKKLGADHTVDYTRPNWSKEVLDVTAGRGVDVVLEVTGGDVFEQSLACLAPFGRLVVYGRSSGAPLEFSADTIQRVFYDPSPNQSIINFNLGLWFGLRPERAVAALQKLIGFVVEGKVDVQVGHVLPLKHAREAHQLLEERRSVGKIVLKPWQE